MIFECSNAEQFAWVLCLHFFETPGKLEQKFVVVVKLANGTLYIVPTLACKDRDEARAAARRELIELGYQEADILDCYVYSFSDIEALGIAPEGAA